MNLGRLGQLPRVPYGLNNKQSESLEKNVNMDLGIYL